MSWRVDYVDNLYDRIYLWSLGGILERINNNVQPEHVVDNTDSGVDLLDDKPEFVKKIESFDVHDLKPENIEFMNSIIQNTF